MTGGEKVGRPADPPKVNRWWCPPCRTYTFDPGECGCEKPAPAPLPWIGYPDPSPPEGEHLAALLNCWDWRAYALQQEARAEAAEARLKARATHDAAVAKAAGL